MTLLLAVAVRRHRSHEEGHSTQYDSKCMASRLHIIKYYCPRTHAAVVSKSRLVFWAKMVAQDCSSRRWSHRYLVHNRAMGRTKGSV